MKRLYIATNGISIPHTINLLSPLRHLDVLAIDEAGLHRVRPEIETILDVTSLRVSLGCSELAEVLACVTGMNELVVGYHNANRSGQVLVNPIPFTGATPKIIKIYATTAEDIASFAFMFGTWHLVTHVTIDVSVGFTEKEIPTLLAFIKMIKGGNIPPPSINVIKKQAIYTQHSQWISWPIGYEFVYLCADWDV